MGQEEWRDFESWPPRGYALRPFHLQAVRLCDVDEDGRSHSICDGLTSISGTDETSKATVPDQQVVHDQTRPSMVILPVRAASGPTIY